MEDKKTAYYTDSSGVTTQVSELNAFHLVNALIKQATNIEENKETVKTLKDEVLRRLSDKE